MSVWADPFASNLDAIATQLETVEVPRVGGDMRNLREKHLLSAVRTVLGAHFALPVVSRTIVIPEWPLLGRSGTDIVVDRIAGQQPQYVGELKWCQIGQDKVYEAIWDLFKMALTTRVAGVEMAQLVTGAPQDMWPEALAADIFDGGSFSPEELCRRRFRRGSQRTLWDYLLEGGHGRHPESVPAVIITTRLSDPVGVRGPGGTWQLRAVAVRVGEGAGDVPFTGGWPFGERPADAREPPLTGPS